MKCPKCKDINLSPTKLDDNLPVMGCSKCGGSLISLLYYRDWVERTANESVDNEDVVDVSSVESHSVLSCPKCGKLMTKYSISGKSSNKIDLCGSCDESWIDGGEWQLLKSLKLSKKIPSVFTDAWQFKVRNEISESKHVERFTKILGPDDIETAKKFRKWVKEHSKRAEILFFVGKD